MSTGKVFFIAFFTSALTSGATFFGLRMVMGPAAGVLPAKTADLVPAFAPPSTAATAATAPTPAAPAPKAPALPAATEATSAQAAAPAAPSAPTAVAAPAAKAAPKAEPQMAAVEVPLVAGKRVHRAKSLLKKAGFRVRLSYFSDEDRASGVVLRQRPRPRTKLPEGSVVRLVVNETE